MGNIKEVKSGIYSEMSTIKIGKFTIAQMPDGGKDRIWIEDTSTGEGGEFFVNNIEKDFEELYNKWF